MKKKVIFLIIFASVFAFVSCPSFLSWYNAEDYKSLDDLSYITEKTTIKPFSQLNEPVVITMPVWETRYYKGKKKGKTRQFKIGDIFVVIDIEKNEVFDWVYFGGETGTTLYRPLELGSPVKYYASCYSTGNIVCLDPDKSELTVVESSLKNCHFINFNIDSKYGVKAKRIRKEDNSVSYDFEILDGQENKILLYKPEILFHNNDYIFHVVEDKDGNIYFNNYLATDNEDVLDRNYLVRINLKNETFETFDLNLLIEKDNNICSYNEHYVSDNQLFITQLNDNDSIGESLLIFKNINNGYELEKEIKTDFKTFDNLIVKITEINGTLYIIVRNWSNKYAYVDIYKLTDDLEMEKITPDWHTSSISENEKFKIDFTDNIWVRGTRIYFMNSRNTSKIAYRYYDVDSGEYSTQPVWIDFNDVVKQ